MDFLKKDVPGESRKLALWRKQAGLLGPEAAEVCRRVLRASPPELHYSALLVLRELGYEAFAHNYGAKATYRIKSPGSRQAQVIRPMHRLPDLGAAADWAGGGTGLAKGRKPRGVNGRLKRMAPAEAAEREPATA